MLRMLHEDAATVRARAERLAALVDGEVEETVGRVGGGALPLAELPSFACAVEESLAAPLREHDPPVIGIVRDGRLLLDCRTLADDEIDEVAARGPRMPLTVGTAGHIDHGKTWLVRALTGKDTDRLPEEQERGISIDLGYAPLELADGRRLSLVDVPGHERFVRTMIAGATGIDLFLLVIDAQEGARPQTLEHLAVLRLLGVERGVVAVTKADAVDDETLALALDEARELVPGAEVVAVSAKTGAGLDELRAALARVPVDGARARHGRRGSTSTASSRSPGVGTIATGTLWSGSDRRRATCCASSRAAASCASAASRCTTRRSSGRRRGSASRSTCRPSSVASSRAATCSSSPGHYPVSYRLDVKLDELDEVPAAVTVHVGTKAVAARVAARRRLRAAAADRAGRRGARRPRRAAHRDDGRRRARSRPGSAAPARNASGSRCSSAATPVEIVRALVARAGDRTRAAAARPARAGRARARARVGPARPASTTSRTRWLADLLRRRARDRLAARARDNPLDPGLPLAELLPRTSRGRRTSSTCSRSSDAARRPTCPERRRRWANGREAASELEAQLAQEEIAKVDDRQLAAFLEDGGPLRRVGDGFAVSTALYERGRELLATLDPITLAAFRDALGRRPAHGAAPARALRRGRADAAPRRRPHAAAPPLVRADVVADAEPLFAVLIRTTRRPQAETRDRASGQLLAGADAAA